MNNLHNLLKYRPLWAARVRTVHYKTASCRASFPRSALAAALPRAGRRGAPRRGFCSFLRYIAPQANAPRLQHFHCEHDVLHR